MKEIKIELCEEMDIPYYIYTVVDGEYKKFIRYNAWDWYEVGINIDNKVTSQADVDLLEYAFQNT